MYAHVFKGKFDDLVAKLMKQGKTVEEAKALAAWIGMRKYGVQGFSNLAAAGKVRAANARAQKQENEMTGFAHVFKIGNGNNQYVHNGQQTQRAVSQERDKGGKSGAIAREVGKNTAANKPSIEATNASLAKVPGYGKLTTHTTSEEAKTAASALVKHLSKAGFTTTSDNSNGAGGEFRMSHADGRKVSVGWTAATVGNSPARDAPREYRVSSHALPSTTTKDESDEFIAAQAPAAPESVQKYGNGNNQWAKNFVVATTPRAKQINARVLAPSKTAILQAQRGYNTYLSTTGQKHGPDAKLEFLRANQSQQKHIGITTLHLTAPPARPVKKAEGFAGDLGLMR